MIISLTGFMGCGKSSVGRILSELLCCPFVDLDAEIEARCGCTVAEIFEASGEAEFRRLEKETLKDILETEGRRLEIPNSPGIVIALGGGAVMTPECEKMVHEQTVCVYLRTSVDELVARLSGETAGRPLLNTNATECHFNQAERVEKSVMQERIASLLSQRSATYEKTAHIIIDTDCKIIDKIAEEIFYKTGNISTDRPRNGGVAS